MTNKTNFIVLLLALAFVVFMFPNFFLGSFLESTDVREREVQSNDEVHQVVPIQREFDGTTYVVSGFVDLPTPCHSLSTSISVFSTDPKQALIALRSEPGDELCAQVITPREFEVSFTAGEDALIRATLNGAPLNLVLSE
ncbi:MAG: hypothetical protein WDZ90_03125 [Candidatus Paceibacterota bacterium]